MAGRRILRLIRNRNRRRAARVFRRREINFNRMTDDETFVRYRFRKETIVFIVTLLSNLLQFPTNRNQALPPLIQVLIALRYFATGAMLRLVGDNFGVSVATVSRVVKRVSEGLCRISHHFIKFPVNADDIARTKAEFFRLSGFPNVVGAVDGTFIRIQAPSENEQDFVNRKGYHSLNTQMTCNANFKITSVNANWPGSVHDSRIFRTSQLQRNFENGTYRGILLGDSGYACKRYLMTPYTVTNTKSKERFNKALCKSRVVIEQTYGILKRRFPCLRGLRFAPNRCAYTVLACATLHNIGIERNDIINRDEVVVEEQPAIQEPADADGNMMRDFICQEHFN